MDLLRLNEPDGEHPQSYYAATAGPAPACEPLRGARTAQVCIIGAGFTGLSAALYLAERGLDVVVLEANRVGWGASGRNGGQLGSGQRLGQLELRRMLGAPKAAALWQLAEDAKAHVRALVDEHGIACDLKRGHIRAELTEAGARAAADEARHLRDDLGYERISVLDRDAVARHTGSRLYAGGTLDTGAGHLHPLSFVRGLARAAIDAGAVIHEKSRVLSVGEDRPHVVRTEHGSVTARRVFFALNGYHGGLERRSARRVMPINNFIVATEPLSPRAHAEILPGDVAVADSKFVVNYWRKSADNRLLFGGGETYRYRYPGDIGRLVRRNLAQVYPQLKDIRIDYAWGGTLGITRSRLPFFRAIGGTRLVAGGFSGHGVALATLAGRLMAQHMVGRHDGFRTFASLAPPPFPGGGWARQPLLVAAMSWYALRDRLGV
ncbi:FAD-dependent oxidoreductase [Rhodobacteraceae bacterium 2CG4]|uniref:FAD-dependent oxidoreductase n=1 Tax=Halovulum marinum TaxID=2662447 RepID=A0A6L5Z4U5_9RHOB|nr:FAD-binding oxidoreductase [Halovulum marinum]MSU91125.1 FAD-dependent oxidoreductase [Halovulum marinum]